MRLGETGVAQGAAEPAVAVDEPSDDGGVGFAGDDVRPEGVGAGELGEPAGDGVVVEAAVGVGAEE